MSWEKKKGINCKMKRTKKKGERPKKYKKKSLQEREEIKKREAEKMNREKKEAWKAIEMLVTKGERPFWFGFK